VTDTLGADRQDGCGRGWRMALTGPCTAPVVPPHRATRALVLACTAVAVGVGAHLAGGGTVGLGGVTAAFPVLLGLAWSLADRERGWLAIAGAQLAGQQVMHSVLEWGDRHPGATGGLPADAFLYAHVVGAAAMAVWLRCGERRAWAAARRAARAVIARLWFLVGLLGDGAPAYPEPPTPRSLPLPTYTGTLLRHAVVRRGPPVHV
jgi:hypothetical protein